MQNSENDIVLVYDNKVVAKRSKDGFLASLGLIQFNFFIGNHLIKEDKITGDLEHYVILYASIN